MRKTLIIGENDLATMRPDLALDRHPKAHKKVVCIETGSVFNSLSEASEKTFGNLKNVTNKSNVCKGKRKPEAIIGSS